MTTINRLLCVVMDGVGISNSTYGNAFKTAYTPNFDYLTNNHPYCLLKAHGTAVGLPTDNDMGNSEVGHNTLGAGKIYPQGATLVKQAITDGSIFETSNWRQAILQAQDTTLHFLGLLSDGNVHSHEDHLYAMIKQASREGAKKIRIHILFDGRDVGEKSAEIYIARLQQVLAEVNASGCDAAIASGGGRMHITMDRYGADWAMVERGWNTHVHAQAQSFVCAEAAIKDFRHHNPDVSDQYISEFIVTRNHQPLGKIIDGDVVIFFNFRGDRALEITKAFEAEEFTHFERNKKPKVFYYGMTQYDGDTNSPAKFLVAPPQIENTFAHYLSDLNLRQYACSETQKYGHVTYFWNGNRSGYINPQKEIYEEIPSIKSSFAQSPWMSAQGITSATIKHIKNKSFDFARINFANGDMVGHTGDFAATVNAMSIVDLMLGQLLQACKTYNVTLVLLSDHGNCEKMFASSEHKYPKWYSLPHLPPKHTAHTLSPVPFCLFAPNNLNKHLKLKEDQTLGLANVANTCLDLMGIGAQKHFFPSLLSSI